MKLKSNRLLLLLSVAVPTMLASNISGASASNLKQTNVNETDIANLVQQAKTDPNFFQTLVSDHQNVLSNINREALNPEAVNNLQLARRNDGCGCTCDANSCNNTCGEKSCGNTACAI